MLLESILVFEHLAIRLRGINERARYNDACYQILKSARRRVLPHTRIG